MKRALIVAGALIALVAVVVCARIAYERHALIRDLTGGSPPIYRFTVEMNGLPRIGTHLQLIVSWDCELLENGKPIVPTMHTFTTIEALGFGPGETRTVQGY